MLVAELNVRVRDFCKKLRGYFHRSMAFNSVSVGFYRSMSSRRLPNIIADVPRWLCRCWTPKLPDRNYLCGAEPTIADLFCYGDVAFAELCAFDLHRWTNVVGWSERVKVLTGFRRRSRCWHGERGTLI